MRAINYVSRGRTSNRGAFALMGGVLLPRARWRRESPLPLVRRVTLAHPSLPAPFEGFTIAQVADVHAGAFMPPERIESVRDAVEALGAEIIVFTGDQLDRRDVDADMFVQGFAGIEAPLGVFGVLGNHDHIAGPELALAALEAAGITPLLNRSVTLDRGGARLMVAGVDDPEAGPGWGPDFSVLRRGNADLRVLLSHQPSMWRWAAAAGADVTLSGHTHGGQIVLRNGRLSVARLGTPYVAGPYRKGDDVLYVSRGVGVGAVPLRLGSLPEIDFITLRRNSGLGTRDSELLPR